MGGRPEKVAAITLAIGPREATVQYDALGIGRRATESLDLKVGVGLEGLVCRGGARSRGR